MRNVACMFDYYKKYDRTNLQCLPDAFYVPTSYIINNVSNVILKIRTLPLLDALRSLWSEQIHPRYNIYLDDTFQQELIMTMLVLISEDISHYYP